MDDFVGEILRRINEVGPGLHTAGTFSARTLGAIAKAAAQRHIRNSVETGSGASTLLFSHLSEHHTVFARDDGNGSIHNVRRSSLLRADVVTFVEGPTQVTLPRFHFIEKLQLVLIDGPHGYPFPDLEYHCLYPHLEAGALLIIDDIHIRSIHNLFNFLKQDAMFRLDQVVETTAFFTRTNAPAFDPFGDNWWQQNYNAKLLLRYTWREKLYRLVPAQIEQGLARFQSNAAHRSANCSVDILAPPRGAPVAEAGVVEGSAVLPPGSHLWILVRRKDIDGWWPQGAGAAAVNQNRWRVSVAYGGPADAGREFEIAALAVGEPTHEVWTGWVAEMSQTGRFPPVRLPQARFVLASAHRTVKKAH